MSREVVIQPPHRSWFGAPGKADRIVSRLTPSPGATGSTSAPRRRHATASDGFEGIEYRSTRQRGAYAVGAVIGGSVDSTSSAYALEAAIRRATVARAIASLATTPRVNSSKRTLAATDRTRFTDEKATSEEGRAPFTASKCARSVPSTASYQRRGRNITRHVASALRRRSAARTAVEHLAPRIRSGVLAVGHRGSALRPIESAACHAHGGDSAPKRLGGGYAPCTDQGEREGAGGARGVGFRAVGVRDVELASPAAPGDDSDGKDGPQQAHADEPTSVARTSPSVAQARREAFSRLTATHHRKTQHDHP
jgi:hypothetical protein